MIPVMINANPHASFDTVMADFEAIFASCASNFDAAYEALDEKTRADSELNKELGLYVRHCRRFVTGLLEWSLATKRYQIQSCLQDDGSALVCL
jgi:hypothetical protein